MSDDKDIDWTGGSDTPENNKLRIIAEARALRAWAYRRLTYSWGDVPLTLTMETSSKDRLGACTCSEVRKQAIKDYIFAQQYIPTEGTLPGRITKGAVQTFLAEMYLTLNKPDSALYWADQAISNPAYKLVTARYGVKKSIRLVLLSAICSRKETRIVKQGNTEALWVFQFTLNSALMHRVHEMTRA